MQHRVVEHIYTKKRRRFGKQVWLDDMAATIIASVPSRPELGVQWVQAKTTITNLDCSASMSQSEVNTVRLEREDAGVNHAEGGWGASVDAADLQQTARYRRRVVRSEQFRRALAKCAAVADYCINQNNAIDIYEEYWAEDSSHMEPSRTDAGSAQGGSGRHGGAQAGSGTSGGGGSGGATMSMDARSEAAEKRRSGSQQGGPGLSHREVVGEPPRVTTQAVLRDPSPASRAACGLSWHPSESNKVVVCYATNPGAGSAGEGSAATPSGKSGGGVLSSGLSGAPMQAYVWDVTRPDAPLEDLLPRSPACCVAVHPGSSSAAALVLAGCDSGRLAIFDTRAGAHPTVVSALEHSHHEAVSGVSWLPRSRTGMEAASVAPDGQVCWWDARRLREPLDRRPLTAALPRRRMPLIHHRTGGRSGRSMVPLTPTSGRGGAGGAGVGTPAAALHARTLGLRSAQRRRASDPRAPRMALLQEGGTGTSASSPTSPGSEVHTVGSGSDSSAAAGGSDGTASVESVNSNAAGRGRGGSSSEGTAASSRASELESDEDGSAPSSERAGSHQDMDGGATLMTTPGRHLGRGIGGEAVHDPRTPGSLRLRPRSPLVLHGAASGTGSGTAFTSPLVHNRRLRHIGGAGTSTSSPTPSMYSIGSVTSARTIGASRPLTPGFKQGGSFFSFRHDDAAASKGIDQPGAAAKGQGMQQARRLHLTLGGNALSPLGSGGTASRLLVGCDQGAVLTCARTVASAQGASHGAGNGAQRGLYLGHTGAVVAVQLHPTFPRYFLTAGDWTARLWSVEYDARPLLTPGPLPATVTGAAWSPARPAVWYTIDHAGCLDAWDLLQQPYDSVLRYQVSSAPLTSLSVARGGRCLAAGDAQGGVSVLLAGGNLATLQRDEASLTAAALSKLSTLAHSQHDNDMATHWSRHDGSAAAASTAGSDGEQLGTSSSAMLMQDRHNSSVASPPPSAARRRAMAAMAAQRTSSAAEAAAATGSMLNRL